MRTFTQEAPLSAQQNEALLALLPKDADPEKVVFWDIETTGLARRYDSVYLIGLFFWEDRQPKVRQLLAASTADEIDLLTAFLKETNSFRYFYTFNGDTFDLPFLRERLHTMRVSVPFTHPLFAQLASVRPLADAPAEQKPEFIDLFRLLRPYAAFLGLPNCKLKTVETLLGIERQDELSGGELIPVFEEYSFSDDPGLENLLLMHNFEDVLNLPQLLVLPAFLQFLHEPPVESLCLDLKEDKLQLLFTLQEPAPFTLETTYSALSKSIPVTLKTAAGTQKIKLELPLINGCLNLYLPNPKDYYMTPSGLLMHKTLGKAPGCRTALAKECFLKQEGSFFPVSSRLELPKTLHAFQTDYRSKPSYIHIEELQKWLQQAEEPCAGAFLSALLCSFLP